MRALQNNGARLIAGTKDSVYPLATGTLNKYLLLYMEQGLSFQTAFEYIQHSEKAKKAMDECNAWNLFLVDGKPDPEPRRAPWRNGASTTTNSKSLTPVSSWPPSPPLVSMAPIGISRHTT